MLCSQFGVGAAYASTRVGAFPEAVRGGAAPRPARARMFGRWRWPRPKGGQRVCFPRSFAERDHGMFEGVGFEVGRYRPIVFVFHNSLSFFFTGLKARCYWDFFLGLALSLSVVTWTSLERANWNCLDLSSAFSIAALRPSAARRR